MGTWLIGSLIGMIAF